MSAEKVVLVSECGAPLGLQDKMQAHIDGALHLAFSVLLYRQGENEREYLLQQRALTKYHSGGLWTNTCCSHPRDGEAFIKAGARRLIEEMGLTLEKPLRDIGHFIYCADLDNALIEHELDHVLIAEVETLTFTPNPEEVMATQWIPRRALLDKLASSPQQFTAWFNSVLLMADEYLERQNPQPVEE
ncbi:isopentenyl-diphosphate Delta-isomerase [Thaumasiovibrio sp. DFM-14]|uniref:isopentenyl-diphosphate Delta-isomerase n=1 Tax=Thaumasiovibrio sp. DFM-14 TaxID=3384792 RepID=UPI0039A0A11F